MYAEWFSTYDEIIKANNIDGSENKVSRLYTGHRCIYPVLGLSVKDTINCLPFIDAFILTDSVIQDGHQLIAAKMLWY